MLFMLGWRRLLVGLWVGLLTVSGTGTQLRAETPIRIAAVVNKDVITLGDLLDRLKLVMLSAGAKDSEETRRRFGPQVLRSYIDETLKLQEAARLGIRIDPRKVEQALEAVARRNGMDVEGLRKLLASRGIGMETLERQIRAELAWAAVVDRKIRPGVVVSEEQIDLALQTEGSRSPEEVRLSEILLPVYRPEQEQQVLADARRIVEAIRNGADFGALARQVSVAASADAGGDLGWVRVSSLNDLLRPVVEALQPGEVSDPIRTASGVRILKVSDRRSGPGGAEDGPVDLAQIVVPISVGAGEGEVEEAFRRAQALRARLRGCAAVEKVAREVGGAGSGRLGWIRPDELPPAFRSVVRTLPAGEASEPVRGPNGFHVLIVCARGGEQAKREQMRLELERRQIQRLANRYLRDLRRDAYIDIRLR